jgi:hypothetical protein
VHEQNCNGATTQAPTTVAVTAHGWMDSQGHRDNVLSTNFDRWGCGAWESPAPESSHYYVCIFAFGPGTRVAPSPTPTPAPTPTPEPTAPTPVPDVIGPVMTSLTVPTVVTSANRALTAVWSATDDQAVTGYTIWIRKSGGAWSTGTNTAATSKTFGGLSGGTWHVGIQAHDAADNWSEFRQTTTLVPTDDRAWAFSSGTVRRNGTDFIKGTETTTNRVGARMTIRFSGSSFVLIGTTAVHFGRMRVVVDGRAYTVDEGYYKGSRATTTHRRVILLNKTLTNRAHTVVITNLGTSGRPTIDVDGAAWRN